LRGFNCQEDAHICEPNLEYNTSLYAVFDGHGGKIIITNVGKEMAIFSSRHFGEELKKC
jgi:serine/threonine protein phosphatase PrpC